MVLTDRLTIISTAVLAGIVLAAMSKQQAMLCSTHFFHGRMGKPDSVSILNTHTQTDTHTHVCTEPGSKFMVIRLWPYLLAFQPADESG